MLEQPTIAQKATKIVATIGPATESEETIEKLIQAGMNVARFNTKHADPAWHIDRIKRVRAVSERMNVPIAVLVDLQGPETRLNLPEGVDEFPVQPGDTVTFSSDTSQTGTHVIFVPQQVIEAEFEGNKILIDDGAGEFIVVAKNGTAIETMVHEEFSVKKRKTVNTPGVTIDMPSLIDSDLAYLDALNDDLVDFVALSFVRNTEDIAILRSELDKRGLTAAIVAKIENQAAIDNLMTIIEVSDAVMVARGDLGVEVPFEQLARWQKELIYQSRMLRKPVITATQMLKSMVDSPVPSRAEVSDVSNAVYDGTDAVMLSEETTIGKYPIKTVRAQASIVTYSEQHAIPPIIEIYDVDATTAVTHAAQSLIEYAAHPGQNLKVHAVICLSASGATARYLSRFRTVQQIHVFTNRPQTYRQLSLSFGVVPHLVDFSDESLDDAQVIMNKAKELGIAAQGDLVLAVHGTRWSEPGLTNSLRLLEIP